MRTVKTIVITAKASCCVMAGGGFTRLERGEKLLLPAESTGENFFTVWGMDGALPALAYIRTENGAAAEANIPVIDWGDVIEAEAAPIPREPFSPEKPTVADAVDYFLGERRARAELITGGGLSLALTPSGGRPEVFALGEGRGGSLRVLDVGSARLLAVRTETRAGERLIMLDNEAETLLDIEGDAAIVEDGRPTAIKALPSVRGLERRERYEFTRGGFSALPLETGFFINKEREPENEAEAALSIAEEIGLGWDERWKGLVDFEPDTVRDFLGDFGEARLWPMEEKDGRVTVGLLEGESVIRRPRRLVFVMEKGRLSDIEEI